MLNLSHQQLWCLLHLLIESLMTTSRSNSYSLQGALSQQPVAIMLVHAATV